MTMNKGAHFLEQLMCGQLINLFLTFRGQQ